MQRRPASLVAYGVGLLTGIALFAACKPPTPTTKAISLVAAAYAGDTARLTADLAKADLGASEEMEIGSAVGSGPRKLSLTALQAAAVVGSAPCVDALLRAGARPNTTTASDNTTALMLAAERDHGSIVTRLVKAGADPNMVDARGWTALMRASAAAAPSAARALLEEGAKTDVRDKSGLSALHFAAADLKIVLRMSSISKADVQAVRDVIHSIDRFAARAELVRVLVAHGAPLNAKDATGTTPLHFAAMFGPEASVRELVRLGASRSARNQSGETPRKLAARVGRSDIATLLK